MPEQSVPEQVPAEFRDLYLTVSTNDNVASASPLAELLQEALPDLAVNDLRLVSIELIRRLVLERADEEVEVGGEGYRPFGALAHLLQLVEYGAEEDPIRYLRGVSGAQLRLEGRSRGRSGGFGTWDPGNQTQRRAIAARAGGYGKDPNIFKANNHFRVRLLEVTRALILGIEQAAANRDFLADVCVELDVSAHRDLRQNEESRPNESTVKGGVGRRGTLLAAAALATAGLVSAVVVSLNWIDRDPRTTTNTTTHPTQSTTMGPTFKDIQVKASMAATVIGSGEFSDSSVAVSAEDRLRIVLEVTNTSGRDLSTAYLAGHWVPPSGVDGQGYLGFDVLEETGVSSAGIVMGVEARNDSCIFAVEPMVLDGAWRTADGSVIGSVTPGDVTETQTGQPERYFTSFHTSDWPTGETRIYKFTVYLRNTDPPYGVDSFSFGNGMVLKNQGDDEYQRTIAASPGERLGGLIRVHDSGCHTKMNALSPEISVDLKTDRARRYATATSYLTIPGMPGRKELGAAIVNFADNRPHTLSVVPGTTSLYGLRDDKSCLHLRLFGRLPEGVSQGGISIGSMVGFNPTARCDGVDAYRVVNFDLLVSE